MYVVISSALGEAYDVELGECFTSEVVLGCTDSLACNFSMSKQQLMMVLVYTLMILDGATVMKIFLTVQVNVVVMP